MPHGVDTSFPVYFMVEYATSASAVGDLGLSFSAVATNTSDVVGTPSGTATAIMKYSGIVPVAVSGTAGTVERYSFSLDVSDYDLETDMLWVMFVRHGTDAADTYSGTLYMYNLTVHYTKWCNGAAGVDHDS